MNPKLYMDLLIWSLNNIIIPIYFRDALEVSARHFNIHVLNQGSASFIFSSTKNILQCFFHSIFIKDWA